MFVFAHTSDYSQVSEEKLPFWRRKMAENLINDNEVVILNRDILREYENLRNHNTMLIKQNADAFKQYDKLLNYQIYKIVFIVSGIILTIALIVAICIFLFIRNNFKFK